MNSELLPSEGAADSGTGAEDLDENPVEPSDLLTVPVLGETCSPSSPTPSPAPAKSPTRGQPQPFEHFSNSQLKGDQDIDNELPSEFEPVRMRVTLEELEGLSRTELVSKWKQQDAYIDSIEGQLRQDSRDKTDLISLRESEEKLKQQQLEATRRENILVMRLTTKEQEMQDYVNQIQELKQTQVPGSIQLQATLIDPAVNLMFDRMKKEVHNSKVKVEEMQNELSAWKFTPDSTTGKRLMAKCRLLYQENEELGKIISAGRLAKLEGDLALQKGFSEEMKKSQSELDEFLLELDEDVEGMQNTIYFLQQQLKEAKDQLFMLQHNGSNNKNSESVALLLPSSDPATSSFDSKHVPVNSITNDLDNDESMSSVPDNERISGMNNSERTNDSSSEKPGPDGGPAEIQDQTQNNERTPAPEAVFELSDVIKNNRTGPSLARNGPTEELLSSRHFQSQSIEETELRTEKNCDHEESEAAPETAPEPASTSASESTELKPIQQINCHSSKDETELSLQSFCRKRTCDMFNARDSDIAIEEQVEAKNPNPTNGGDETDHLRTSKRLRRAENKSETGFDCEAPTNESSVSDAFSLRTDPQNNERRTGNGEVDHING